MTEYVNMNIIKNYVKLFSSCIPIKGASRSAICDIHRNDMKLIPNALYDLIPYFDDLNCEQLISYYGENNICIVQGYLDFLIINELAFRCSQDEIDNFPKIDFSEFHIPNQITNAILELNNIDIGKILTLIGELNGVNCPVLEIRILTEIELLELETLIILFAKSDVNIVELHIILPDNNFLFDKMKYLFEINLKLTKLIICNASYNSIHTDFFFGNSQIVFTTRKVNLPTCCGNFSFDSFIPNVPFFTESQKHNTCLNRKVAIDKDGNIKNCPSMNESFGNIEEVKLVNIIKNKEFTAKWFINKDQIKICQDCEFRHVCMDCRAYLEDPDDLYSKPLKCGYNPYTMEWEEWSTNPLKQKAIEHYNLIEI